MIDQKSIAVLPFNNLNNHSDELYLIDGISDEIINALSKIEGLKVSSRRSSFSYRDSNLDARRIGNELNVATLLEGSIRIVGNRIRLTVQLVKTDTGFQLWAERFDRVLEDIFELQDEISIQIAERIRENFGHMEIQDQLFEAGTNNLKAYDAYLKGNYSMLQLDSNGLVAALNHFNKSIHLDSEYPMPYLGLAQSYIYLSNWGYFEQIKGMFMAHRFIEKLGDKNHHLPEYHFTKGLFHFYGKWDFKKAEQCLLKSLSLNPNFSDSLQVLAMLYNATGEFKDAESTIRKALELNPNSPKHHYAEAKMHYLNANYSAAVKALDACLAIEADWQIAKELQLRCLMLQAKNDAFQKEVTQLRLNREAFIKLQDLYLQRPSKSIFPDSVTDHKLLKLYYLVYSNEKEQALELLSEGIDMKQAQYLYFANDPLLKPLFQQPAFLDLKSLVVSKSKGVQTPERQVKSKPARLNEDEIEQYQEALYKCLTQDQFYLNPEATLSQLAKLIEIHPNKLSWLLNEIIGKNFNDYLNEFRTKTFQEKALLKENSKLTLLGLAYDSGFNSKSVFNDFFKKYTGSTPKQWVKENT